MAYFELKQKGQGVLGVFYGRSTLDVLARLCQRRGKKVLVEDGKLVLCGEESHQTVENDPQAS